MSTVLSPSLEVALCYYFDVDSGQGQSVRAEKQTGRRRPRRRRLIVNICIMCGILVAIACILWQGAREREKMLVFDSALQRVKCAADWGMNVSSDEHSEEQQHYLDLRAVIDGGYLDPGPANPYLDEGVSTLSSADSFQPGTFGMFLIECDGEYENNIVVGYYPAPTWAEVAWTWANSPFFMRSLGKYSMYETDWSFNTKPQLLWSGGDCGHNQVWIARGLAPAEALRLLREDEPSATVAAFIERSGQTIVDPSAR